MFEDVTFHTVLRFILAAILLITIDVLVFYDTWFQPFAHLDTADTCVSVDSAVVHIGVESNRWSSDRLLTVKVDGCGLCNVVKGDMHLAYDPQFLQVADMDEMNGGTQVRAILDMLDAPEVTRNEETRGAVHLKFMATDSVSTSSCGQLFYFDVTPLQSGKTTLHFDDVRFTLQNGEVLPVSFEEFVLTTPSSTEDASSIREPIAYMRMNPNVLEVGDTGKIEVILNSKTYVNSVEFYITYDTATLEIIDAIPEDPGIQVTHGNYLHPDVIAANIVEQGVIHYAISQSSRYDVNGEGVIMYIPVRALQAGTSRLHFQEAWTGLGDDQIQVTGVDWAVSVE